MAHSCQLDALSLESRDCAATGDEDAGPRSKISGSVLGRDGERGDTRKRHQIKQEASRNPISSERQLQISASFHCSIFIVQSARIVCGRLFAPQFLEEQTDGLDAAMEVGDVELLVGSVQVVVRKAESHHHAGNLKHVLKVGDDRN